MKKLALLIVLVFTKYMLLAQPISFKETINKDSLGMKNGEYMLQCDDNILIKGFYKNDKRVGKWEFYGYNNLLIIEGYYLNGEKNGIWKYYYNGKLSCQIEYKKGLLNGTSISYYLDGYPREVYNYEKGKLNGEVKIYFSNNYLSEQRFYKNGQLDSTFTIYDSNNQPQIKIEYKDGHPYSIIKSNSINDYGFMFKGNLKEGNGNFFTYENTTGKPEKLEERNYVNSKLQGIFKYYYRGYEVAKGSFENGILVGKWKFFNDLGQLLKKKNYKVSDNYPIDSLGPFYFKIKELDFENSTIFHSEIYPKFFDLEMTKFLNTFIYSRNKSDNHKKQNISQLNSFDTYLQFQFDKANITSKGFISISFTVNLLGQIKNVKVLNNNDLSKSEVERIKGIFSNIPYIEPAYLNGFPINNELVKSIDFK